MSPAFARFVVLHPSTWQRLFPSAHTVQRVLLKTGAEPATISPAIMFIIRSGGRSAPPYTVVAIAVHLRQHQRR